MLCSHFAPFPSCFSSFSPLVAYHLCVPKRMSVPESLWYAQAAGSCVLQRKTRGATGSMPWLLHTLEFRHLMAFPACQKGLTSKQKGGDADGFMCLTECWFTPVFCSVSSQEGAISTLWRVGCKVSGQRPSFFCVVLSKHLSIPVILETAVGSGVLFLLFPGK